MDVLRLLRRYQLHHSLLELDPRNKLRTDPASVAALERRADNFAAALEELGPCFIKLGQLLSTRPDLLPPAYIQAMRRLQDRITPVPSAEVRSIIERELGKPVEELFAAFEDEPVATASMAQVHRAALSDGTQVAVKVQRPGVKARTKEDLEILNEFLRFARRHVNSSALRNFQQIVSELEEGLIGDMDFMEEALNTQRISRQLADFPYLSTPEVYINLSTSYVLTQTFVEGKNLSKMTPDEVATLQGEEIAGELLTAYMQQIVVDGIFHCDPHPGNILITPDGKLTLLDFGMVGRFDAQEQNKMIQLLLAFSERQGERVADIYLDMIEVPRNFDIRHFRQDISSFVSRFHDISGGRIGLGTMFLDLVKLAEEHDSPVPSALTLLSKALLNLDGIVSVLSPQLDPVALIRQYMVQVMKHRVTSQMQSGRNIAWALDVAHLLENAPRRAETILNKLANDQLSVQLRIDHLEETGQKLTRSVRGLSRSMFFGSVVIAAGYVIGNLAKSNGRKRGQ
jgi:predicted unusual protein kinase regulating ubiquinone biosynthesis (AarF/ABC1/UbiB family)